MTEFKSLSLKAKAQLVFILLVTAMAGTGVGYGIGWFQMRDLRAGADEAATALRADVERMNGELAVARGEIDSARGEIDGAVAVAERKVKLAEAVVLTTRAALEAKVANYGNADDLVRKAVTELRAVKESVPADEAAALDEVLGSYDNALAAIAKRADDASQRIMNAATLLEGHRSMMGPATTP